MGAVQAGQAVMAALPHMWQKRWLWAGLPTEVGLMT
jgi:hypothetical protein